MIIIIIIVMTIMAIVIVITVTTRMWQSGYKIFMMIFSPLEQVSLYGRKTKYLLMH